MIASLTMYDAPSTRPHIEWLWECIAGWLHDADSARTALDWSLDHLTACRADDLLVAQTCGWPLVTMLDGVVDVVGTFDADVPGADSGHYRSALIAGPNRDAPAAVNGYDSLSGWISLRALLGDVGDVTVTGSHAASLRSVATGQAAIASIDAVSLALLGRDEPELVSRVRVIDHGPRVPCLPLVTRRGADVDRLRAAFTHAVSAAPDELLDGLRIRSFVPLTRNDYTPVRSLAPTPSTQEGEPVGEPDH